MIKVDLRAQPEPVIALWEQFADVATVLPPGWVLVGGLMVQSHLVEREATRAVRITTDIDLLGRARHPENLRALAAALTAHDFALGAPDLDGYSHRLKRRGLVVDLLAPDGLGRPVEIVAGTRTVGIPGGSQALARAEQIRAQTPTVAFDLLRPSLLGAILLKARALRVHRDPEAQLTDLARLLAIVDDPFALGAEVRGREASWLRSVEPDLADAAPDVRDAAQVSLAALIAATA